MCFLINWGIKNYLKILIQNNNILFTSTCNLKSTDQIDFYHKCKICLGENRNGFVVCKSSVHIYFKIVD